MLFLMKQKIDTKGEISYKTVHKIICKQFYISYNLSKLVHKTCNKGLESYDHCLENVLSGQDAT